MEVEEARRKEEEATVALLAASAARRVSKQSSSSSDSEDESSKVLHGNAMHEIRRMEAPIQQSSYNGDLYSAKASSSSSSRSVTPSNAFPDLETTTINTEIVEPKVDSAATRRMKLLEVSNSYLMFV